MSPRTGRLALVCALLLCSIGMASRGGDPPRRWYPTGFYGQPIDPANPAPSPGLGTFYRETSLMVGGSYPIGPGYSPLSQSQANASLYGPLSAFRAQAVVVPSYTRGYDGRTYVGRAVTFSYPNFPPFSPVVYPTQGSRTPGPLRFSAPAGRPSAVNWIDQN
jgi:hypothetical protein